MAASTIAPESTVSSTTVQVSTLGGAARGQQFLIVNQGANLHSSGGAIQIVTANNRQEKEEAIKRREILARQPSYCKILNDLKEAESSESEDREENQDHKPPNLAMKGETVEVVEEPTHTTQTVVINGQQYQIVTPTPAMESLITTVAQSPPPSSSVQYTTTSGLSGGGAVFLPAGTQQVVTVGGQGGACSPGAAEDGVGFGQQRKREIRLMKNREAARECRNKKKEYIKCLENRVAVLENQNKALIEELKNLKELYTGQKN